MLEDKVAESVRGRYQQLLGDGKLPSREQLDGWYATFRQRFGPEKLGNLDGRELLETMHLQGTRDSLTYSINWPSTR